MQRGDLTVARVVAALIAMAAGQAHGQAQIETQVAADSSADATPIETTTVTVTGLRASEERGVAIKRGNDQIVDTVSATEIGELPDFNAGDALKRVAGVDTILYQGEPRFVIVRGFNENYNDILIDGFTLASTDINLGQTNSGGRQVSMEVLPANLAAHIDVVKSATPATDANFIGGLTNFVTPSAFDFKDNSLSASLLGGVSLDKEGNGGNKPDGQAEVSGAKRFGDRDQFGLYLSATYWLRDINVPQTEMGGTCNWYTAAGAPTTPYGGTGYAVPSQRLYYNYQDDRDREGLQARFDWKPSDSTTVFFDGYHFHQDERAYRNDLNAAVQSSALDLDQAPTTGTLTNVTQTIQLGRLRWHRNLSGLYSRLSSELGGGWQLDVGSSWSVSAVINPQTWDNFAQAKLQLNYDTAGATPLFSAVNPAVANNAALYPLVYHREELYHLSENRFDEQINLGYNAGADDRGLGFAFGARGTGIYQKVSFSRTSWSGAPYTLANVLSGSTLCAFVCDTPIPVISAGLADSLFTRYKSSEAVTVDTTSAAGGTFDTREVVVAEYAQAQYRGENWYIVGGVRFEDTHSGSSSTQATNGVFVPVEVANDYLNVLPSALAVIDTSSISKLRLGASETVSRPTFGESSLHGGVLTTTSSPPTLSVGNPDLKPRRADNFDIAHDWYIDHGRGIISAALFYKLIHDDIFTYGTLQTVPGVSQAVLVTEARNSPNLVHDEGVEFSVAENLSFLPAPLDGFGVSANATWSRARFPITLSDGSTRTLDRLPDQPLQIYNASVYYDRGRLHGRLAWNHLGELWDDRYPNFTPAGFYANRYQQPTNNLDLQASFDVTPYLTLSLEGLNLTGQGMKYDYGRSQELLQSEWALPTEILVGVKLHY